MNAAKIEIVFRLKYHWLILGGDVSPFPMFIPPGLY